MQFIALLRGCFPWYGVMASGVVLFALTEVLGGNVMGPQIQSVCGAAAGTIAALGLLMRLHEVRHPGEMWRPPQGRNFAAAAKTAGFLAGAAGVVDSVFRSEHSHYQSITLFAAICLAIAAAALARMAKLTAVEESLSCN